MVHSAYSTELVLLLFRRDREMNIIRNAYASTQASTAQSRRSQLACILAMWVELIPIGMLMECHEPDPRDIALRRDDVVRLLKEDDHIACLL